MRTVLHVEGWRRGGGRGMHAFYGDDRLNPVNFVKKKKKNRTKSTMMKHYSTDNFS